jgi:hypothetical protein
MSEWRRRAIESFPQLRNELNDKNYSLYLLFGDLLPMVRHAHCSRDWERVSAIYDFAEWCAAQPSKELWKPAGVSFYEHLFDEEPPGMKEILPWVSPRVRSDCRGLWEWRLPPERFKQLDRLLKKIEFRLRGRAKTSGC